MDIASVNGVDKKFTVAEAKEWWYGKFKKSTEYSRVDIRSPYVQSILNHTNKNFELAAIQNGKMPSWRRGIVGKIAENEYVELPLFQNVEQKFVPDNENLSNVNIDRLFEASLTRLFIFKGKNGIIKSRIITIIPEYEYAEQYKFDLSHLNCSNLSKYNFRGFVFVKTWDEKPINIWHYGKNGFNKVSFVLKNNSRKENKQNKKSSERCVFEYGVVDIIRWCIFAGSGDEPGNRCEDQANWREREVYGLVERCSDVNDDNGDNQDNNQCEVSDLNCLCSLYGLCENDYNDNQIPDDYQIDNLITDPCIKNAYENLNQGTSGIENHLTHWVQNTFGGSLFLNLSVEDVLMQTPNNNGDTTLGYHRVSFSGGTNNNLIKLNLTILSNSTQERITQTIMHEMYHAYLEYLGLGSTNIFNNNHAFFNSYRDNFSSTLQLLFPNMSMQDAKDLAWGGLMQTPAFSMLSPSDQLRIKNTNWDYLYRRKGQLCQ